MESLCEYCYLNPSELEGWFYAVDRNNEYAKGTTSYGLLQRKRVCKSCAEDAINKRMTPATEIEEVDEFYEDDINNFNCKILSYKVKKMEKRIEALEEKVSNIFAELDDRHSGYDFPS